MRLSELNPRWIGAGGEGITNSDGTPAKKREGVGISFNCPCGCGSDVYIGFENPLDGGEKFDKEPHPSWKRTGDTFDTLTTTPSILRVGGCKSHFFITNGEITGFSKG